MMSRYKQLLVLMMFAALAGCSGSHEPAEETADAADAAAAKDHVWKEQVETIDRAKDVEKTLMENDEAKRKAMKDAGGG